MKTTPALCFSLIVSCPLLSAFTWDAGLDLLANELPNGPSELTNPNAAAPAWSYGYRSVLESSAITLFSTAVDHINNYGGNLDVHGWSVSDTLPAIGVNTSASPVIFDFGAGPLLPVPASSMVMHPSDSLVVVVRWTVPATGTYTFNTSWQDLDPNGGNGVEAAFLLNGTTLASSVITNDGSFTDTDRVLNLDAGDVVDYALGANGQQAFDNTLFNATVTSSVPESSSLGLFAAAVLAGLTMSRRG